MANKKEVRHLEGQRDELAGRYQEQKARAERLAISLAALEAENKAMKAVAEAAIFQVDTLLADPPPGDDFFQAATQRLMDSVGDYRAALSRLAAK